MSLISWIAPLATRAEDRVPRVISPRLHAVIDYATVGAAAFIAYKLWNRNRRAAVSAVVTAVTEATVVAMTDYPGGFTRQISFPLHGRLALGHATMIGNMPRMMGFQGTPEEKLFAGWSAVVALLVALTDFSGTGHQEQHHLIEAAG
jgi:hypothetical protein